MVLPAPITSHILASMGDGGGAGGGEQHFHYHGYAGQNDESMRTDAATMMKQHQKELRRQNKTFN
jgi:hypothetical protein